MKIKLGLTGLVAVAALCGCDQTVTETLPNGQQVSRTTSGLATHAGYARASNQISGDYSGTLANTADGLRSITDIYANVRNFGDRTRY